MILWDDNDNKGHAPAYTDNDREDSPTYLSYTLILGLSAGKETMH